MGAGAKKRRDSGAKARRRSVKDPSATSRPAPTAGAGPEPGAGAHQAGGAPEARRFEAFGRVMAALATEAEFMQTSRDLTWWQGTEQDWNIEWREGPYASDVAAMLAARIPGPVGPAGRTDRSSAAVTVLGVPFTLRAIDPLGRERPAARAGLWRLAAALNATYTDTPRQAVARRHWEELLGG